MVQSTPNVMQSVTYDKRDTCADGIDAQHLKDALSGLRIVIDSAS